MSICGYVMVRGAAAPKGPMTIGNYGAFYGLRGEFDLSPGAEIRVLGLEFRPGASKLT